MLRGESVSSSPGGRLIAGVLSSALLIGAYTKVHSDQVGDMIGDAYGVASEFLGLAESECPAPSEKAVSAVRHMLAEPANYSEVVAALSKESPGKDINALVGPYYGLTFQQTTSAVAPEYGQKEDRFAAAQKAANAFGIVIELAKNPEEKPTKHELTSNSTSTILSDIAIGMRVQPKEYYEMADLGRIVLYSSDKIENDSLRLGYTYSGNNDRSVYINISDMAGELASPASAGPSVLDHEIGHRIDLKGCGNSEAMANDPSYIAVTGDIYTEHARRAPNTEAAYQDKLSKSMSQIAKEMRGSDDEPVIIDSCAPESRVDDQKRLVQAPDDYSLESPKEHKASINAMLATPGLYPTVFDPEKPMSESAIHQMAQWYELNPNVVAFNMAKRAESPC